MDKPEAVGNVLDTGEVNQDASLGCSCLEGLVPQVGCADAGATLPVVERFVSINGEGRNAGKRAAFIRFRRCNLRCSYCDTAWAWGDDCAAEMLTVDELVDWVSQTGVDYVTLTGGEPLLQLHAPQLIAALTQNSRVHGSRLVVEIETNGSVSVQEVAALRADLGEDEAIQLTMDWKMPSSGMNAYMLESNLVALGNQDVLKMVMGTDEDLTYAVDFLGRHSLECQLYVSPVSGRMPLDKLADAVASGRLPGATMQLQLHKIIWPQVERGV